MEAVNPIPMRTQTVDPRPDPGIVGSSSPICLLRMELARLAPLNAPVLIVGESGTGKELVARGLHTCSNRADNRFVAVNCGALTETMFEDILFGHERGAFTGAGASHCGLFAQAHGGTLFLDEIGELPFSQQAALLRVLDTGIIRRIGAEREEKTDFRLVVATNRNLTEMIKDGTFRLDLYHRLATLKIVTPPLRDRPKDISLLARHFLAAMEDDVGRRELHRDAVNKLEDHSWPGNARELRNVLYRAAAFANGGTIHASNLDIEVPDKVVKLVAFRLDSVPDSRILETLAKYKGNVAAAARQYGVARTTLRDRVSRIDEMEARSIRSIASA